MRSEFKNSVQIESCDKYRAVIAKFREANSIARFSV